MEQVLIDTYNHVGIYVTMYLEEKVQLQTFTAHIIQLTTGKRNQTIVNMLKKQLQKNVKS